MWTPNWRELIEKGLWSELDWFHAPEEDWPEILEMLERVVPKKRIRNGLEEGERYCFPEELDDPELKAAAMILRGGELEAAVRGEPAESTEAWTEDRRKIESWLETARQEPDDQPGDPEFSRRQLLENIRHWLGEADTLLFAALNGYEGHDKREYRENLSHALVIGLHLGVSLRAAEYKPFEPDVLRGQKVIDSARQGGATRKGQRLEMTKKVLAAMREELDKMKGRGERRNVSLAAQWVFKRGLGTSPEANRSLWKRHNAK